MKRKRLASALLAIAALSFSVAFATGQEVDKTCPIAENFEITTYRNVSVDGQLRATDPNGDVLSYKITTEPTKGKIDLEDDGSFVYTPAEGKRGRDYFGYRATDAQGNSSSEATVLISIKKQKTEVCYSDLEGCGAGYAACMLAEQGIFVGECVGGQYMFRPEAMVTRGDFLKMCMELSEYDVLSGVITTGFSDDNDIPSYLKPYVSTALLAGVIKGYSDGSRTAVFDPNSYISYPEAAVILNKTMRLTDVSPQTMAGTAPVWAEQACSNLSACRISDYPGEELLTRADCANMLLGAMQILGERK